MEQDFHGNFQVNGGFLPFSLVSVAEYFVLILVWFERSLHSAQVSELSCPWPLKLMTSQTVEGRLTCTGTLRVPQGRMG